MKKVKKTPLRTCVVTREVLPKKELIRICATKDGVVSIDLMGDTIDKMTTMFSDEPAETPGLFSRINKEYFQRINF